jgi:hypothetical protein
MMSASSRSSSREVEIPNASSDLPNQRYDDLLVGHCPIPDTLRNLFARAARGQNQKNSEKSRSIGDVGRYLPSSADASCRGSGARKEKSRVTKAAFGTLGPLGDFSRIRGRSLESETRYPHNCSKVTLLKPTFICGTAG